MPLHGLRIGGAEQVRRIAIGISESGDGVFLVLPILAHLRPHLKSQRIRRDSLPIARPVPPPINGPIARASKPPLIAAEDLVMQCCCINRRGSETPAPGQTKQNNEK